MRLIYLSPVPWASFSQRPHHFVNWYHEQTGAPVFWIDPYPTRLPSLNDLRYKRPLVSQETVTVPSWLHVCKPPTLPIEPIPGSALVLKAIWQNIFNEAAEFCSGEPCMFMVGKPCELALQLLDRLPQCYAIFDAMDDFPAFYQGLSRAAMERRQEQIIRKVSSVLVSSTALRDKFSSIVGKVELVRNACDVKMLEPVENLDLGTKQQVIGYVGTVAQWFDWPLVIALARCNPAHQFRLIGPIFTQAPSALPSNIELLPECSHANAMAVMATFSIGLIPFKLNRLTASVDPIKYYEYRALGLPVISTCFGEMAHRGQEPGVLLVDGTSDLRRTLAEALASQSNHETVQQFRQANRWVNRFSQIQVLKQSHALQPAPQLDLQTQ